MESVFKIKTKEELLNRLHYIKQRKHEQELEAKAEYQALQKATEGKRQELYATIGY